MAENIYVIFGVFCSEQPGVCAHTGSQPNVHEEAQMEFAEAASAAIADGTDAGQLVRQYAAICRAQAAKLRSAILKDMMTRTGLLHILIQMWHQEEQQCQQKLMKPI